MRNKPDKERYIIRYKKEGRWKESRVRYQYMQAAFMFIVNNFTRTQFACIYDKRMREVRYVWMEGMIVKIPL